MSDTDAENDPKPRENRGTMDFTKFRRKTAVTAAFVVLTLIITLLVYGYYYESKMGPEQPIAFSHRVHAGHKQISCLVCHSGATAHQHAGLPPLQTCMLCHQRIIITHPEVAKVRSHYAQNKPVVWAKVTTGIGDFVFFNHAAHVLRSVDCSQCHGNVNQMDRVAMAKNINMGFCVDCHRQHKVSHDCYMCHR